MPPWEVYEDSCGTRMATTATEPGSRPCLHYLFQQQRWTKVSTVREIIYSRGRKFIQLFPLADWAWVSVGERKSGLSPRTGRCLATCKRNCQRRRRNMRSRQVLRLLRDYESRNVTCVAPDGSWPIVWERARGMHVWDAEGKKYLDVTDAFGVAAAGHANPRVVRAGQKQMGKLLHAMGDVHPHALKARLARELSRITFERWPASKSRRGKTIFCNSGFEAV